MRSIPRERAARGVLNRISRITGDPIISGSAGYPPWLLVPSNHNQRTTLSAETLHKQKAVRPTWSGSPDTDRRPAGPRSHLWEVSGVSGVLDPPCVFTHHDRGMEFRDGLIPVIREFP
jgi:hypothetical protein